jgi:death on curing protein
MPTEYLSQFDVLQIRTKLAAQTRESYDELNLNNLQSALAAPRQAFFGEEMHPSIWDKAATLLTRLILNHPFYDGNKRIAMIAVREFLERNGYTLHATDRDALILTRGIALGDVDADEVERWLRERGEQRTENGEQ